MQKNLSISEACARIGISRGSLYSLWKMGKGPRKMKIGRRTLISSQALDEWFAQIATELESCVT